MDRYDKADIRFSQMDCEHAHERIVGAGYVDMKCTEVRRGSYGEILWWKRWTFWSHKRSTSFNQQNNHKLLKLCSHITHTPYNTGTLLQPDDFRTCLDFWFGNQLTGKARHSSQDQLNLLTWNKTQKPPVKRIHFGICFCHHWIR